jgi:hypothetical protein
LRQHPLLNLLRWMPLRSDLLMRLRLMLPLRSGLLGLHLSQLQMQSWLSHWLFEQSVRRHGQLRMQPVQFVRLFLKTPLLWLKLLLRLRSLELCSLQLSLCHYC